PLIIKSCFPDQEPRRGRLAARILQQLRADATGRLTGPTAGLGNKSQRVDCAIGVAVTGRSSFLLPIPRGSDRPPVARSLARQIGGFSAAEDRSPPTWGKPEAARSGGVLLAPLPEQRKCGLDTRGAKIIGAIAPECTSPSTSRISRRIPGRY